MSVPLAAAAVALVATLMMISRSSARVKKGEAQSEEDPNSHSFTLSASALSGLEGADAPGASSPALAARRTFVRTAHRVPVPMELWVAYRMWVDDALGERSEENFHWFVCERTLGMPNPATHKVPWTGSDAGDLLACLAQAGLLGGGEAGGAQDALDAWLDGMLVAFDHAMAVRSAAQSADLTSLAQHLSEGHGLDEQLPGHKLPPCGETALHLAASAAQPAAVALLLERRADVHARTFTGWSAVHLASQSAEGAETLALLLSHGADARAITGVHRVTPLHVAASHGRVDAVKLLLLRGAELDSRAADGLTALEQAQRRLLDCPCRADLLWPRRHFGRIVALLEKLAPLPEAERRTFLVRSWELHVSSEVLQPAAEQAHDPAGLERLRLLLCCYQEDVDARDHDGSTALHAAAHEGRAEAIALLLSTARTLNEPPSRPDGRDDGRGRADVRSANNLGETALHVAARGGHAAATAALLEGGADPQGTSRCGARPIELAQRHKMGEWEAVAALLRG